MRIFALALGWKIGLSVVVAILALVFSFFTAIAGPGSNFEGGQTSDCWWVPMAIAAVLIGALWYFGHR